MQDKGITPKDVYTWEELRDLCLAISDPGQAPVRLGHDREPVR